VGKNDVFKEGPTSNHRSVKKKSSRRVASRDGISFRREKNRGRSEFKDEECECETGGTGNPWIPWDLVFGIWIEKMKESKKARGLSRENRGSGNVGARKTMNKQT